MDAQELTSKIIYHGHPGLTQLADSIPLPISPEIQALADELMAIMMQENGVGIAAPQIGRSLQLIIVASRPNLRYPDAPLMEPLAMINPKIHNSSTQKVLGWEGCLSVPGLRGSVERSESVEVSFYDLDGVQQQNWYHGFVARIIQHECDHLLGKVFLDRVRSPKAVISEDEYFKEAL